MRDIANILFIFILVFVAIGTILGQDNKKLIARVILVALIINFSLFLTKVVVDFGNITARFFYNNIAITNTQSGNMEIFGTSHHKSISYGFAAIFNPVKLLKNIPGTTTISSAGGTISAGLSPEQYAGFFAVFSIVGAIINLVAAYVFFSLAWLFIARTAGIWLSMVFAPLAFLSLALPSKIDIGGAGKYMNMSSWRSNLFKLAVMPAIALLMIFLVLTFLKGPDLFGVMSDLTTTGMFLSVLIPLIVLAYLLIQTKKTAESMSGEFGAYLGKVGSFVGGAAIGVATGGAALAGRRVLGAAGARLANNESLKTSRLGRNLVSAGRVMESSTYDLKNTKVAQFGLKKAGFNPNEYVNTTVKTGYKDLKESQIKSRETYKESMKLSEKSAEVRAITKAKEAEDKSKEKLEATQKAKREAQNDLDTLERRRKLGIKVDQQEIDDADAILQEKMKEHKDAEDAHGKNSDSSKLAKAISQDTNATIIEGITKSESSPLKFIKSEVTGSVTGRYETIKKFRDEAKKERDGAQKARDAVAKRQAAAAAKATAQAAAQAKAAATKAAQATATANAAAAQAAAAKTTSSTAPQPPQPPQNTGNQGGGTSGSGSIINPIIVGGGQRAPGPINPANITGIAKPAPAPTPSPTQPTAEAAPSPTPAPAPNSNPNGFSAPTIS